jgi:hypothetical protein
MANQSEIAPSPPAKSGDGTAYPKTAAVVRMAAASQNWSVATLAEAAGVSRDSLSSAHSGRRPLPPGFAAWLLAKNDIELEAFGLRRHNVQAAQAERRKEAP